MQNFIAISQTTVEIGHSLSVWLENAYSGPFREVFWRFDPTNGERYQRHPKRQVLGRKDVIRKPDSGKLAIRPDHPRYRSAMWIYVCGHIWEIITYAKFYRNPFNGFGATGC